MSIGVNIQWGYAGLFNVGIMGFAALGGVAAVLTSQPPVHDAWAAGGVGIGLALLSLVATIAVLMLVRSRTVGASRVLLMLVLGVGGFFLIRYFLDPAVAAIEATDAARTGYHGGAGLPVYLSWIVGGLFAAAAAWLVGRLALGLWAASLAIATLGISDIIIAMIKTEDWLTRGVRTSPVSATGSRGDRPAAGAGSSISPAASASTRRDSPAST